MSDKPTRIVSLQKRIERFERRVAVLTRRSTVCSWLRLSIFFGGLSVTLVTFLLNGLHPVVGLLITLAAFAVVVTAQRRINQTIRQHKIWITLKRQQIARIELDWPQIPLPPFLPDSPHHPFSLDLDLTGERSIVHLLDTAVSYEGSLKLQEWLLSTTLDPALCQARQQLVRELTPMARFRDKLSLNGLLHTQKSRQQSAILQWLRQETPESITLPRSLALCAGLAVVNVILWLGDVVGLLPPLWQITVVVYLAFYFWNIRKLGDLFHTVAMLVDELQRLRAVFHQLETYPYAQNTGLKQHVALFLDTARRPSAKLRQLNRLLSAASIRGNWLLWLLLSTLMPWDLMVAYRLQRMKTDLAALMPRWLVIWFELESLGSLATFAYLNPEYTFPELLTTGTTLRGQALGHPLIPFEQKVCNDYSIEERGAVDLITGSNMSGKSSFLRTLGVNLCLAYAGGPVSASALSLSPFRLFTCIQVSDSVTDGVSYFYAEVKRLKALLNALQQPAAYPLFFLIDEIFRGTNNRERLIGSRAYIQSLVGQNGVGLIATHDLELVKLADELPKIRNYHFEESIVDGRMDFDYKLRTGPSPTTNALKIMAMEGLPIPQP